MMKEKILYTIFALSIIIYLITFRVQMFNDGEPTIEEIQISRENINQKILEGIEGSEKESFDQIQEDKMFNDCLRIGITNNDSPGTYFSRCADEAKARNLEKFKIWREAQKI